MRKVVIVSCCGALSACSLLIDTSGLSGGSVAACDGGCSDGAGDVAVAVAVDASDARAADAMPMPTDGEASPPIAFVQSTAMQATMASTLAATINPTTAGNLVMVAVTQDTSASMTVAGVTDDAPGGSDVYVSAGRRSVDVACNNTAEIWYAKNVAAGARTVTITMSASSSFEIWVTELSGLQAASPLETGAVASDQPTSTQAAAPRVTTASRAFVVSTIATCGETKGLAAGSPFVQLPAQNGQDTAYYVAPAAGSYGASWITTNFSWNASTVAFH